MIEFKNVYKKYDSGTEALKNINLRIDRGEFVFIVGASGSGKSTFLKTIMREEVPTSGTIMINNYDLTRMTDKEIPYFRRTMGIVFQDFRLIPNMTVYDNVAFAMRVIGANEKEIKKRVPYVLSLVGLQNKARSMPNEISGGEQQRVALARALVNNANTIIADEPTGNIDPEMSYEIVDLLNHINENGTTVIMVTHEHELVKKFDHRIVVLDHGSIISDTATGGQLSYDATTGYKPIKQAETVQEIKEPAIEVEVIESEYQIDKPVVEPAVANTFAAPEEGPAPVAQPAPVVKAVLATPAISEEQKAPQTFADIVAPNAEEPEEVDPIQAEIAAKVAAAVATPAQSSYMEQLAALAAAATPNNAGEPLKSAPDALTPEEQMNNFANIDGVDYSKYFETEGEV